MNKYLFFFIALFFISACTSTPIASPTKTQSPPTQTPSPVPSPTPSITTTFTPTSTPTITPTASPTPTPTATPTTIGGSEPRIAFIAKDLQGNTNLYIDSFFTGQPQKVTQISPSGEEFLSIVKWSPDVKKLLFVKGDEYKQRWLFLYNLITGEFRKLYLVPAGRYIHLINWSLGPDSVVLVMANEKPPGPALSYLQIDLKSGELTAASSKIYWFDINDVTRANSQTKCHDSSDPIIQRLQNAGYRKICYYPEIGLYGGSKESESGVDYVLLSKDGQVQRTLIHFPVNVSCGTIDLLLSPDKSRLLLLGDPSRFLPSRRSWEGGIPIAIPISVIDSSIPTVDPETLFYNEPIFEITPPPHVLWRFLVYGWSPDSRSYLAARFYIDSYDATNYTAQGEFIVINADSGDIVFTYNFADDIDPFLTLFSGFDLVWAE